MKTVAVLSAITICSFLSFSATAGCVGTVVMGECSGTEIDHVNEYDSGFESTSGTQYEYDLSNPGERIDYGYDNDAQRRDQMSADPNRSLDQQSGQIGGGIYD